MFDLELGQIDEIVRICLLCDLSSSRTNAVPGEGDPNARIFLIGEAPGSEEDRLGRPFVGRAGQILNGLLTSIGLDRRQTFVTGVVKCRPPHNRDPREKEKLVCNRYLRRQLELIDPCLIVPMGRHAASCIFQMYGLETAEIGMIHGKTFVVETTGGRKMIVPTYHPAVITHNPRMRRDLENDFQALRIVIDGILR
ncbi:MAG: uracil-DNA glycosylase [Methanomicrobiales archaeon]|nr:uracil-DNA glycosylase [Methanomicrobiales archaeon]